MTEVQILCRIYNGKGEKELMRDYVKRLGVNRATYYNWMEKTRRMRLSDAVDLLDKIGLKLEVVKK